MQVTDDRLSAGSVIFEYVTDTTPPKNKYYVVVGISGDEIAIGTVYINTEINPNVFRKEVVRKLHILILQSENPFLKYDSYIDCSVIHEKKFADVKKCIDSGDKKYGYINSISPNTLQTVIETLDSAYTISPVTNKKYGIRNT